MKPLRSVPCPHCNHNQVWSKARQQWRCPDCHWPEGLRRSRDTAIDESRAAYRAGVDRSYLRGEWRP